MDMKLEVVVLPVADVDRSLAFYTKLGWRHDADIRSDDGSRIVQCTPLGSACSVIFGTGISSASPGTFQDLILVVADIQAAHAELESKGVSVGELFHGTIFGEASRVPGPDPDGNSYASLFSFKDPDGNGYLVQQITQRLPGR